MATNTKTIIAAAIKTNTTVTSAHPRKKGPFVGEELACATVFGHFAIPLIRFHLTGIQSLLLAVDFMVDGLLFSPRPIHLLKIRRDITFIVKVEFKSI